MKEIGGYFGFEQLTGKEYYSDLIALNTGRNALVYIIKARNIRKLYIPFYLCDSVSAVLQREGVPFEYYHTGEDFAPIFDRTLPDGEFLYIVNYFGQVNREREYKEKYGNIIWDNVQAFFRKPAEGIDTIYSCRKFFGVPDGAYLASDSSLAASLPEDSSQYRMTHILGRCEGRSAGDYYGDFKKNDASFRDLPLRLMSPITHNILRAVDYEKVRQSREDNFALLHSLLGHKNRLNIRLPEGPYAYPFYCPDGMKIKKLLAEKYIFVPTLWPCVLDRDAEREKDYAANILPLPCDQRYGREDMGRIAEEVLKCMKI